MAKENGTDSAPSDQLKQAVEQLVATVAGRAASSITQRLAGNARPSGGGDDESGQDTPDDGGGGGGGGSGLAAAATSAASKLAEGKSPVKAAVGAATAGLKDKVKNVFGGGGGGGGNTKPKVTNIVESIDIGVPLHLAYAQWTRFTDFPKFMKKVENVEQVSDEKLSWKAQIFWSHRSWEATIQEQVPGERIIWRSEGDKGYVDGAVTFHELTPTLTRVIVVLEYYPKGFFEHTGNLWRAQGRRVRLELKHFARQAMAEAMLRPDEIEGWEGEIRDGEVVDSTDGDEEPDDAQAEDEDQAEDDDEDQDDAADRDDAEDDDEDEDEDEDELDAEGQDEDDAEDEEQDEEPSAEDEGPEEEKPRRRRPAASKGASRRTAATTSRSGGRAAAGSRSSRAKAGGRR